MHRSRLVFALAVAFGFAGCSYPPAELGCNESSEGCACLLPEGVCVECTPQAKGACSGATPACGDDHTCRGCIADDECDSAVCNEDGTCANPASIIYAAMTGANSSGCGRTLEQNECSLSAAVAEVTGTRNIIKLRPGTYGVTGGTGQDILKPVVLVARGSTLNRASGTGPILTVTGPGGKLTLLGGTITGATAEDGIDCRADGTLAVRGATITNNAESGIEGESCSLEVSRSIIRHNLRGGINMNGSARAVTIRNNFIYGNGQQTVSPVGGMSLLITDASKVEFNTVVDNIADFGSPSAGGIKCNGSNYNLSRNLVYRNTGGTGGSAEVQGSCNSTDSFVMHGGPGENVVGFKDPDAASPSYHLTASSPSGIIRDAFECSNAVDFDGDRRPTGDKCDYGADEYRDGQ